jgi:surface protein
MAYLFSDGRSSKNKTHKRKVKRSTRGSNSTKSNKTKSKKGKLNKTTRKRHHAIGGRKEKRRLTGREPSLRGLTMPPPIQVHRAPITTVAIIQITQDNIYKAVKLWLSDKGKALDTYGHISYWDVGNVTNMSKLFYHAEKFNQDIGNWDVSNVTDMSDLFAVAKSFNNGGEPLKWDVSKVTDMNNMFAVSRVFNQPLKSVDGQHDWDVSNVTNMEAMFNGANSFNNGGEPLKWDVSKVTDMNHMFDGATSFNQPLKSVDGKDKWDVSNVETMVEMFMNAKTFNQDISNWDVSNVEDMSYMFNGAESFNQDISNWVVSNVEDMSYMFLGAKSFYQGDNLIRVIKSWDPYIFADFEFDIDKSSYDNLTWSQKYDLDEKFAKLDYLKTYKNQKIINMRLN